MDMREPNDGTPAPRDIVMPDRMKWLEASPEGRTWLGTLPALVQECAERWSLRVGRPFDGSNVSLVMPAVAEDGTDAVLKIQFPGRESEHEAAALAHWDGDGAVRLIAHDAERHALLVERCRPGNHLSESDRDQALDVLIGLLPRLWKPATAAFRPLAEEVRHWDSYLPGLWERAGRPFERELVDATVEILDALAGSQGEQVLLHQDLHADNVLRAERESWLVIDPKPLAGEREFGIAPIVRGGELGHSRDLVVGRLDRLTDELGLDRERARGWALAQTVAWGFDGERAIPEHLETARWLLRA